jgi:AcrR family transcriptional regulator
MSYVLLEHLARGLFRATRGVQETAMSGAAGNLSDEASDVQARLLDAAESCFSQFGLTKTTMEDVARAAGMSRATVYRYFKNRDDLLMGVVEREARSAAREIEKRLRGIRNPGEYIVEGIVQALDIVPKRPALSMLFLAETVGVTSRLLTTSARMVEIALELVVPVMEPARQKGLLREEVGTEVMIEWTFRIISSFLTVPSPLVGNDDEMRALLRTMLLPALLK